MDQNATTTIAETTLTPAGIIFENIVSKVAESCPNNLSSPFIYVGSDKMSLFRALACGLQECAFQEVKNFSRKGRVNVSTALDFIDTFTLDVFPGEVCELTLNAGILVPKDKILRHKYLNGEDVGHEWVFEKKLCKQVFIPLAVAKHITHTTNTVKFFKNPIVRPRSLSLSLSVECERERERCVSIKQILVQGGPRNIITFEEFNKNPLGEFPLVEMLNKSGYNKIGSDEETNFIRRISSDEETHRRRRRVHSDEDTHTKENSSRKRRSRLSEQERRRLEDKLLESLARK